MMHHISILYYFCLLGMLSCNQSKKHEPQIDLNAAAKTYTSPKDGPQGMVWIPPGQFTMGTTFKDIEVRDDEKSTQEIRLSGFWMDTHEVTNEAFQKFVQATGYITTAERKVDWEVIKKQLPPNTPKPHDSLLQPSSMVFTPVNTKNLQDWTQWWAWVRGADWKHPQGPESSIENKEKHPVVQISWDDAQAYLKYAGKRLPTEAEWEYAARGGSKNKRYPWGNDTSISKYANTWQGSFPIYNSLEDGFLTTAPVKSFEPNAFELYDMAGNVWEWTADWYNTKYYKERAGTDILINPDGAASSYDPTQPYTPQRVQKGGSFLCDNSYCSSYRNSAKMHSSQDSSQDHTGFRGVLSQEDWDKMKRQTK